MNALTYEIEEGVEPRSREGVREICNILEEIDSIESYFQGWGMMSPYITGEVENYLIKIHNTMGIVIVQEKSGKGMEYCYRYSTIEGALGWILCKVGMGNNSSRYEAFSKSIDGGGQFPRLISSMEERPSKEEILRYEKLMDNMEKMMQGGQQQPGMMGGGSNPGMSQLPGAEEGVSKNPLQTLLDKVQEKTEEGEETEKEEDKDD
jgi:hypothetical protein